VPSLAQMIKVADNPFDQLAEPILLKVNLPDDWRCDRDPNDFFALTSRPIPSKYIDAIIALKCEPCLLTTQKAMSYDYNDFV
jgi:hypothetical protein